jgi:hypothetical protein
MVFAHGGGIQSTAALVLSAVGALPFREFVFANVGDDSEAPGTLAYLDQVAKPYAREHGIRLTEVRKRLRDGTVETLWGRMTKPGSRSLPIPVRFSGGAPAHRACTADFKIRVIGRELRRRGACALTPATVGIGISVDEIERANTHRAEPYEQIVYPLLDLGLRRSDCARIIRDAGLPVPPKSACWFCPFRRRESWFALRREQPQLFARAARLEEMLTERRALDGKDPVYLTDFGRPLQIAIPEGVQTLPVTNGDEGFGCDGGWCAT